MNTSIDVRTVIITGASSGIGFALAEAYLAGGYNVVGNARSLERLNATAGKLRSSERFLSIEGDISLESTAKNLFERAVAAFGKVDILVNNAGIFSAKPFAEYTAADLEALVDTNLKGFVYPSQQAAAHMAPRKQGHIVSIAASLALQPAWNTPAALPILIKGGIMSATRALALELAPHNVKVNAVAPGVVDTPLHAADAHSFLDTLQPLGRIGSTQDVVDAVLYLTGSDFVTGVILPVDGGMSAGRGR